MLAKDLMTTRVVHVSPGASLKHAIRMLIDNDISGLPVIDDQRALCGMITEGDILKRHEFNLAPKAAPDTHDPAFFENYVKAHGLKVEDCMSRKVVSVAPGASVAEIVALMRLHAVKRIPVLDNGVLAGIVSRRDILKIEIATPDVVARGDEALRLAVATRLLAELGLGKDRLEVKVRDSVVEIIGEIGSDVEQEAIRILTASIAGVGGVVTQKPSQQPAQ
ncbi:CBS domain-containing protein [Neorhizobium galegae]|uniref:CBS domain-containing protein n=1 Tax=Neorhizobium galegae TaxID=399 RepID=UPI0006214020|nr:CBS domain-containing protein [Neorhizobium galegae]MCQ1764218.1 CBS domain-containing protein [Neorhizobium galegae]MCQ1846077.1 CBS domain-containing protein [Neorhizobium galegae]CDZ35828.1 Putative signal-transduction protein containing cAMP-binding and CBS domains [Neorhizobium galegae bv. officinalis]